MTTSTNENLLYKPSDILKVYVSDSNIIGLGVFAHSKIHENEIIEACPVIIIPATQIELIDHTALYDYYYAWQNCTAAIALGYGSLYNHSSTPNALYTKDAENSRILITALKTFQKEPKLLSTM